MKRTPLLLLCMGGPTACDGPAPVPGGSDTATLALADQLEPLSDTRLLRRMALDLIGELPTVDEYLAVEADPDQLAVLRDAWLEDPRFEERMVRVLGESWQTRVDEFEGHHYDYLLDDADEYTFERAVGEEPLRLMARIVYEDRPWSEVVTTDTTVAPALLAELWGLEGHSGGEGFEEVRYTDERPAAGVLATNGLWWRYPSTEFNQNRTRASTISRMLVCEDLLSRPVSLAASADLLAAEDTSAMVRTEDTCLACHATIEPIAASLYGFYWTSDKAITELERYHPERELMGPVALEVNPSWFGTPITGLSELGPAIASDERFARCAARTFAEGLLRRELELDDRALEEDLLAVLEAEALRVKPMIVALTESPQYRAGGVTDLASDETIERENTARLLNADQLASVVTALTGFTWTWSGFALLDDDEVGFRVLAGGVDGRFVSRPQQDPGLTWALTLKRLAEGGAAVALSQERVSLGGTAESTALDADQFSLPTATLDDRPGDAAFDDDLGTLLLQLHGERPDADTRAAYEALWQSAEAEADAAVAWQAVLVAALRDPQFVAY